MKVFLDDTALRFLQNTDPTNDSSTEENTDPTNDSSTEEEKAREVYEFVAFLAWYVFLVMCCVVPTACAYRRRRANEARLRQQVGQREETSDPNGLVFLRGSTFDGRPITIVASPGESRRIIAEQEEQMIEERTKNIKKVIDCTSMAVAENDFLKREEGDDLSSTLKAISSTSDIEKGGASVVDDVYVDDIENDSCLVLPSKNDKGAPVPNGSRAVPSACAICLCPYEKGDTVTWSPKEDCQHAFHQDCIVPWLAKKEESLCPCCRQEFCVAEVANTDIEGVLRPSSDMFGSLGMRSVSMTANDVPRNST